MGTLPQEMLENVLQFCLGNKTGIDLVSLIPSNSFFDVGS